MKKFKGDMFATVTMELWDGTFLSGEWEGHDSLGVTVKRTSVQHDYSFVPWHSIKIMNGSER